MGLLWCGLEGLGWLFGGGLLGGFGLPFFCFLFFMGFFWFLLCFGGCMWLFRVELDGLSLGSFCTYDIIGHMIFIYASLFMSIDCRHT